jgi:Uma2 family endonuclease
MLAQASRVEIAERMTAEEFFQYAPDNQKAELIDGVLHMSPPPLDGHEREQGFLFTLIRLYVELFELGEVRGSRTAVRLSDDNVFEPDILFVAAARAQIIQERGVMGAPDLVVEILSASTAVYDRGVKFHAYDAAGVRELWLIDPYGPAGTEFFQRRDGRLRPVMPAADGWLASPALPGFRLQTAWLWPRDKFIAVRAALAALGADF